MMLISSDCVELIMVTYCRPNELKRSIDSIIHNTNWPYHLSIIDNSHGKIDNVLNTINDKRITIYKNSTNIGKGRAFGKWYNEIMQSNTNDCFVSIDPDVIVPKDWLQSLLIAREEIILTERFGALAPTLITDTNDTFDNQLQNGFVDHIKGRKTHKFNYHIYYNHSIAGPLLLIDKDFYEEIGGYSQNQLYGDDDGKICRNSISQKRFIGILTDLNVQHLKFDVPDKYIEWKHRNIKGDVDHKGFWD